MPRAASFAAFAVQTSKSSRPWPGRGVHEAGAGVVGDVIAGEEGDSEIVSPEAAASGWSHTMCQQIAS